MTVLAITVLGHDRPGIIAETTTALAELGLNIEDTTMTLLRGHFAMMLITGGAASAAEVEEGLAFLTGDGSLSVSVRELPQERPAQAGVEYLLSVHGGDRAGIVAAITGELARVGGNITDLTTRLSGELYVLLAQVELPQGTDAEPLLGSLKAVAADLGVDVSLRELESDDL